MFITMAPWRRSVWKIIIYNKYDKDTDADAVFHGSQCPECISFLADH